MKRFNKFLALFLVVVMAVGLLPATASAASNEILTTGLGGILTTGFEDIEIGHTFPNIGKQLVYEKYWDSGAAEIISTDGHNSDRSVKLTASEHSNKNAFKVEVDGKVQGWLDPSKIYGIGRLAIDIPTSIFEPGATYVAGAWFKTSRTGLAVNINVIDANYLTNNQNIDKKWTDVGPSVWVYKEVEFIARDDAGAHTKIRFGSSDYTADINDYVMVDDIRIVKIKDAPLHNEAMSESFESWVKPDTVITNDYSIYYSTGSTTSWNGATPTGGWTISAQNGKVMVQPVVDSSVAHDGEVCIKLSPDTTNTGSMNRAKLRYQFPDDVFNSMEDGAKYIFTVWFKSSNANGTGNYEIKHTTNVNVFTIPVKDEWTEIKVPFTLDKTKPLETQMCFYIGIPWHNEGKYNDDLYIDSVSLVKAYEYNDMMDDLADGRAKLVQDVSATGTDLVLKSGDTLDLNGKTLTVDSLSAMPGAKVIDTVGGGKLVVTDDNLTLQADNGYLPVKTNDGYIFVTVKNQHEPKDAEADTLKYKTRPSLEKVASSTYLGDGAADNGLSIIIRLTWTNASNGTTTTMDVKCLDELVRDVYTNDLSFELTVTGVDSVENLQVATVICSDTGVVVVGDALSY